MKTLTHDEYDALNDGSKVYWFQAIYPEKLFEDDWAIPEQRGLRIQFLNVTQPTAYLARNKATCFVLPSMDRPTYAILNKLWPSEVSTWAYIIRDSIYGDLDDIGFFFRDGEDAEDGRNPLPKFDLRDGSTH